MSLSAHSNSTWKWENPTCELRKSGDSCTGWFFFYRHLQRYPVLNRSYWLSCLWSRRGQEGTLSDPLSQASNSLHFSARSWTTMLPEDINFYRNLPCTERLMAQTNLFSLMHRSAILWYLFLILSYSTLVSVATQAGVLKLLLTSVVAQLNSTLLGVSRHPGKEQESSCCRY